MEPKSMLLVFNPVAGSGAFAEHLYQIVDRFTRQGYEVTVHPTSRQGEACDVVLERGADFECIVCSGGDGTLNEVVSALMRMDHTPPLGYIPSGTTNDFAHTHGLPTDVLLGAKTVFEGVPVPIDIGRFQEGYFTYVAAFGLFTDVSYGTPQGMKNILGHAAYILQGIKRLAGIHDIHCVVECDGEVIEGDFILGMVANTRSVAGFKLPEEMDIQLDDGCFELILLRGIQHVSEMQEVISVLTGRGSPGKSFVVRSARHVRITCDEPLDWTVDGEFGGSHRQVDIRVERQAIQILSPQKEQEQLSEAVRVAE